MLTTEDRKIRAVDGALEVLAKGIGQALLTKFGSESIEDLLRESPGLKAYQRSLFASAASDPSTMLILAIDHASALGLEVNDLHKLRQFRNGFMHKKPTAGAANFGLDEIKVGEELNRAMIVLAKVGYPEQRRSLKRYLMYYLAGAPEQWSDPDDQTVDETQLRVPTKPPKRITAKQPKKLLSKGGLSHDQVAAIEGVRKWWTTQRRRFAISGAAGTGKTRLIHEIIADLGLSPAEVRIVAPTNKACEVLREKLPSGLGFRQYVSTFHSLIYKYRPPTYEGEDMVFATVGTKPMQEGVKLIICDEASMLTDIAVDALESHCRTLYLGDAAQLPPVIVEGDTPEGARAPKSSSVLDSPDAELTVIHRQSGGSSILEAAALVRQGEQLQATLWDDDATQVLQEADGHVNRATFRQLLRDSDAVLVAKNVTRVRVNQIIRQLRGFEQSPSDWLPKPGELLVATERTSDREYPGQPPISNGQQLVVDRVVGIVERTKISTGEPVECIEIEAHFQSDLTKRGRWVISREMLLGHHVVGDKVITKSIAGMRSGVLRCDWGYALTVHKAQGSEWGRVVIVDHGGYDRVSEREWYYVALTRARTTVTVVRLMPDSALLA